MLVGFTNDEGINERTEAGKQTTSQIIKDNTRQIFQEQKPTEQQVNAANAVSKANTVITVVGIQGSMYALYSAVSNKIPGMPSPTSALGKTALASAILGASIPSGGLLIPALSILAAIVMFIGNKYIAFTDLRMAMSSLSELTQTLERDLWRMKSFYDTILSQPGFSKADMDTSKMCRLNEMLAEMNMFLLAYLDMETFQDLFEDAFPLKNSAEINQALDGLTKASQEINGRWGKETNMDQSISDANTILLFFIFSRFQQKERKPMLAETTKTFNKATKTITNTLTKASNTLAGTTRTAFTKPENLLFGPNAKSGGGAPDIPAVQLLGSAGITNVDRMLVSLSRKMLALNYKYTIAMSEYSFCFNDTTLKATEEMRSKIKELGQQVDAAVDKVNIVIETGPRTEITTELVVPLVTPAPTPPPPPDSSTIQTPPATTQTPAAARRFRAVSDENTS